MYRIIAAIIVALGLIIGAYIIAQSAPVPAGDCAAGALCQDLTPEGNRVTCSGRCVNGKDCTVHFRADGSSDKWEDTDQPRMDRQGDGSIEYSCRC